ncbi:hormogonium polysaccharide biosynthesis protein HpsA [Spirulina major]|uniref:hormogonium polysaccharide biosynthesis protein HpsA n=1 Tax=Spirulina major TaxID=270636 RepID=UPI0009347AB1|nr:hormogonium polysaccharide biosynthesis protein HpsA [Spirulina major]
MLKRLLKSLKILWQELIRLPQRGVRSLQTLLRQMTGQERGTTAGFVLPTVTMVTLVVVLTSATLVLRSMDRAKNASNFRVSQVVMNAAAPAIDRAKAKVENLFADPSLPRGTPSDSALSGVFERDKYTLEDEVRLQVAFDADGGGVNPTEEAVKTAWRFPVDTDNNGKFDSFTLYGVYYQSTDDRARVPFEARTRPQVLNATESNPACPDASGTSASLVETDGWYEQDGVLKKAFFTYVATVPISNVNEAGLLAGYSAAPYNSIGNYENFKGNPGFTALEYQQDRARIPLGNNAIVTEDDLDFTAGTDFRISGRILTNSNFVASERGGSAPIKLEFYQVSSPHSCFYEEENGKIIVQGNVGMGRIQDNANADRDVDVHLFSGIGNETLATGKINTTNRSVNNGSNKLAYNTKAYEDRISALVDLAKNEPVDPPAVTNRINERLDDNPEFKGNADEIDRIRSEELEIWFRNRTRKVPAIEVPFNSSRSTAIANIGLEDTRTDNMRPSKAWILPADGNTKLQLKSDQLHQANPDTVENEAFLGDRILVGNNLPAIWWDGSAFAGDESENTLQLDPTDEFPPINPGSAQYWYKPGGGQAASEGNRYRLTRARRLDDVGVTGRDGFWELMAQKVPEKKNEAVGGLRIVTGAGIYLPANLGAADNPASGNYEYIVWPDWMPQPPDPKSGLSYLDTHPYRNKVVERYSSTGAPIYIDDELATGADTPKRPYLKMRASAVYHYRYQDGKKPIACVSSFYDPTDWKTARNRSGLEKVSGEVANNAALSGDGFSNNGIVYGPPLPSGYEDEMKYQANLVYPNGRPVNPMLKKALSNTGTKTIAEQSALDAARCGFKILANPTDDIRTNLPDGFNLAHGTIQEVAFLDGRQIKSTEKPKQQKDGNPYNDRYNVQPSDKGQSEVNGTNPRTSQYDLELEHRLPMEIRSTVIDFYKLRQQPLLPTATGDVLPSPEYMFPVSGIVYATRNDGLADASNRPGTPAGTDPAKALLDNEPFMQKPVDKVSATDYWLDPTRRPNAIMIVNARRLNRENGNNFQETEKGLTLVSNLPVYIKAESANSGLNDGALPGFNIHDHEEFTTKLATDWGNFYTRGRTENDFNKQFACRKGDDRLPKCTEGDKWRPANILSDAATLLSDQFRFGFRNEGDYDIRNNQSDNFFRNPRIYKADEGVDTLINTAKLYPETSQALLPANGAMRNEEYTSLIPNTYKHIGQLRSNNGFPTDASFAVNGLSSEQSGDVFVTAGQNRKDEYYSRADSTINRNDVLNSTYFNNFVSPVQRRVNDRYEYVMETCLKLPVSQCKPEDWYFSPNVRASDIIDSKVETLIAASPNEHAGTTARPPGKNWQYFPRRVAFLRGSKSINGDPVATTLSGTKYEFHYPYLKDVTGLRTKSWTKPAPSTEKEYWAPPIGSLFVSQNSNNQRPIPIAVKANDSNKANDSVTCYTYDSVTATFLYNGDSTDSHSCQSFGAAKSNLKKANNTLWYFPGKDDANFTINNGDAKANNLPLGLRPDINAYNGDKFYSSAYDLRAANYNDEGANDQPSVLPVPQLNSVSNGNNNPADPRKPDDDSNGGQPYSSTAWLPQVADYNNNIHFNMVLAAGDSPIRDGEGAGGIGNIPRLLENWSPGGEQNIQATEIRGSLIQLQRSAYATAPFFHLSGWNFDTNNATAYGFRQKYRTGSGRFQYYEPSGRQWGFDVGMLSQLPDLFSQQFSLPPTDEPNEYFREVSRNDDWIRTLLCAEQIKPNPNYDSSDPNSPKFIRTQRRAINGDQIPNNFCDSNHPLP